LPAQPRRFNRFRLVLLAVWAAASFGVSWFARDLQLVVSGWPINFWFAAQGAIVLFLTLVVLYAIIMNRKDATPSESADED